MFENLEQVLEKYNTLNDKLCQSEVLTDPEQYTALLKERAAIETLAQTYQTYRKTEQDWHEAKAMAEDKSQDEELRELAKEEAHQLQKRLTETEEQLKILLLPKDPNDDKNVIIEIRGGAGGEESALFAGVLYRMYTMYCEKKHFQTELLSCNETERGGYKEISFLAKGSGAYSRFKFESGVHRVQRVPETESQGRIHTSTVTVAVLPEAQEVEVEINPADLQIDTFRAGGADSILTKPNPPSALPICPPELLPNVRTSAANTKTRTRPCAFCVRAFYTRSGKNSSPALPVSAKRRLAPATGASVFAPITIPSGGYPTTASI